jgi:Relaxase/Mobilisation nuclease domain
MIIKGNPAGSVGFWSKHLLRDDTNERAEVKEITGLLAQDLPSALREMKAIADQSRSHGNFMYQANINPRDGEHLTPEQWKEAVDTLERNLGLEGHQRVVVEHVKHGRQHYHIIWNRVDVETLRVADMGGNWPIHNATARELEARFDLTPTPTPSNDKSADKKSAPELYEIRAAERSGIDPNAIRTELTELWNRTETGKEFAEAIEKHGFILAKGDRRDFCIIDEAGDAHSLARRLDGVKTKDVRERLADIDRDSLPTVAEARAIRHMPEPERGEAHTATDARKSLDAAEKSKSAERVEIPREAEAVVDARKTAEALKELKAADRADNAALREAEDKAFWKEWREGKDAATAASTERWEKKAEAERARIDPIELDDIAKRPALAVVDAAGRVADSLVDFVGNLLSGGPPRKPANDFTAAGQMEQVRANRRAAVAMENIRESLEKGHRLSASDLQNLTPSHLENIRQRGDDYLRSLVESNEFNRPRELDYGRVRER